MRCQTSAFAESDQRNSGLQEFFVDLLCIINLPWFLIFKFKDFNLRTFCDYLWQFDSEVFCVWLHSLAPDPRLSPHRCWFSWFVKLAFIFPVGVFVSQFCTMDVIGSALCFVCILFAAKVVLSVSFVTKSVCFWHPGLSVCAFSLQPLTLTKLHLQKNKIKFRRMFEKNLSSFVLIHLKNLKETFMILLLF